ncbi:MAG: hypothetical protein QGM45_11055 [Anaerolineales bacterium]|nr:hypothetical protein [Anaerolineales bacterium]
MEAIQEVEVVLQSDSTWQQWQIVRIPYNQQNSFRVDDIYGRICSRNGPVVFVEKVQRRPLADFRVRASNRTVIITANAYDAATILKAVADARGRFETREQSSPARYVLAILIVRKLAADNFWGGSNKGYMWAANIPKGRGIPDNMDHQLIFDVVKILHSDGLLIRKTSQGKHKYALNPSHRVRILQIVKSGQMENENLKRILNKGNTQLPTKLLDS